MDFAFPAEFLYPLAISAAFPFTLLAMGIHRGWRANNAARFLAATVLQTTIWALGSLALPVEMRPSSFSSWLLSAMVWLSALLLYLEVWALLSRGYTLAMLLVLLKGGTPQSDAQIAHAYRGGAGLAWIMRHRLGGLLAAGMVTRRNGEIALTGQGALIARGYALARAALGLRRSG